MDGTKRWFGVKTLYRWIPHGRPRNVDRAYDRGGTLVEERVVLFRAASPAEAIRMAEREAKAYAQHFFENPYGQGVRTRYLGACDCFELFEELGSGKEVFSETYRVSSAVRDRAVRDRFLGSESELRRPRRRYSDQDVERRVRARLQTDGRRQLIRMRPGRPARGRRRAGSSR